MEILQRATLTSREAQCLAGIAEGLTNSDVAVKLQISTPTVALHLQNAKRKLGAATREHAVALAIKSGLLS